MIFQHTADWIFGVSPHTGKPKTETSRIVVPSWGNWERDEDGNRLEEYATYECPYRVGKSIAVQPGRGKKAIGHIVITGLGRGDCREMRPPAAQAEGFPMPLEFLILWTKMHDKPAHRHYLIDLSGQHYQDFDLWARDNGAMWMRHLSTRPAERYDRWIIQFEAIKP